VVPTPIPAAAPGLIPPPPPPLAPLFDDVEEVVDELIVEEVVDELIVEVVVNELIVEVRGLLPSSQ
jgi:hypothetical protein